MTMTNTNCTDACTVAPRTAVAPRISVLARVMRAHSIWRERQKLKSLDEAALKDIGVTRTEALAEAKRSIWDAPDGWTR